MEIKTIGIASDHAAFQLKQFVKQYLEEKGIPVGEQNERPAEVSVVHIDRQADAGHKGTSFIKLGSLSDLSHQFGVQSCPFLQGPPRNQVRRIQFYPEPMSLVILHRL